MFKFISSNSNKLIETYPSVLAEDLIEVLFLWKEIRFNLITWQPTFLKMNPTLPPREKMLIIVQTRPHPRPRELLWNLPLKPEGSQIFQLPWQVFIQENLTDFKYPVISK